MIPIGCTIHGSRTEQEANPAVAAVRRRKRMSRGHQRGAMKSQSFGRQVASGNAAMQGPHPRCLNPAPRHLPFATRHCFPSEQTPPIHGTSEVSGTAGHGWLLSDVEYGTSIWPCVVVCTPRKLKLPRRKDVFPQLCLQSRSRGHRADNIRKHNPPGR